MSTETKVTKDYFEFGTIKYFRGKGENVEICSYGEKKHPLGGAPYLAVQAKVNRAYLKDRVDYITSVKVDWSKQSEAAVEVNGRLKYFDLNGKVAVSGSYQNVKSAKLGCGRAHRLGGLGVDERRAGRALCDLWRHRRLGQQHRS
jgi:hypothetical protein